MGGKTSKNEYIYDLQRAAETILDLKDKSRYRRPIVIEFSGSPKSGKTSSINSLEVFLKRNGISVKIIEERASICPVPNKQSPMFNYWTLLATLKEIIGVMTNNDCVDVLLIDRGIFDALCWFEWLVSIDRMDPDRKHNIEEFLLNPEFTGWIDIVFAFVCEPDVSIKREYANLLTDKTGSIMNTKVLSEYRKSIERTIYNNVDSFKTIHVIDSTDKDQNQIGVEVTTNVLDGIKELLMERIGYLEKDKLPPKILTKRIFDYSELANYNLEMSFDYRSDVEDNNNFIQPIPVAIISNIEGTKLLVVKKTKAAAEEGSPERNNFLLHVGGHVRVEDSYKSETGYASAFMSICKIALNRELNEELQLTHALPMSIKPFVIYDPQNPKSAKHMAICFQIAIDENNVKLSPNRDELVQNKGKSRSCRFTSFEELSKMKFDNWGELILKTKYADKLAPYTDSDQLSLSDLK